MRVARSPGVDRITMRMTFRRMTSNSSSPHEFMILLPRSTEASVPWKYQVRDVKALQLRSVAITSCRRPEHSQKADDFYGKQQAKDYLSSNKVARIQREMTETAVSLLQQSSIRPGSTILDIGCGPGLSGKVLDRCGYPWIGLDISYQMLKRCKSRHVLGLVLGDMLQGLPFRDGQFPGVISISTLQWAFATRKPKLDLFCSSLYRVLQSPAAAILQFYPRNYAEVETIMTRATDASFNGALVVTSPHTNTAKKLFLCLFKPSSPTDEWAETHRKKRFPTTASFPFVPWLAWHWIGHAQTTKTNEPVVSL